MTVRLEDDMYMETVTVGQEEEHLTLHSFGSLPISEQNVDAPSESEDPYGPDKQYSTKIGTCSKDDEGMWVYQLFKSIDEGMIQMVKPAEVIVEEIVEDTEWSL